MNEGKEGKGGDGSGKEGQGRGEGREGEGKGRERREGMCPPLSPGSAGVCKKRLSKFLPCKNYCPHDVLTAHLETLFDYLVNCLLRRARRTCD